jgi:hypothetical protein
MPAQTITYPTKDKLSSEADEKLWRDLDANEVKTVVQQQHFDVQRSTARIRFKQHQQRHKLHHGRAWINLCLRYLWHQQAHSVCFKNSVSICYFGAKLQQLLK